MSSQLLMKEGFLGVRAKPPPYRRSLVTLEFVISIVVTFSVLLLLLNRD